jgi:hypothetical protein
MAALVTQERKLICFALVENISENGAKLSQIDGAEVPDRFILLLSSKGRILRKCVLVWQTRRAVGVRFVRSFVEEPPVKCATH